MALAVVGCGSTGSGTSPPPRPTKVFKRIGVVGASVSAGFGGVLLADAFTAAAPGATVTGAASVLMFRDAVANGAQQVDTVLAASPDLVVAIDFLFWHVYNGADRDGRLARLERGLADLDRARTAGAAIVVGDVPLIVTAAEMLIPKSAIPPADDLVAANARLRAWAAERADVLVVPFASWAEPLAAGADVEVAPGERVPARELMSFDGLHPNAFGVWYVLSRIDALVEDRFAVAPEAWRFQRP